MGLPPMSPERRSRKNSRSDGCWRGSFPCQPIIFTHCRIDAQPNKSDARVLQIENRGLLLAKSLAESLSELLADMPRDNSMFVPTEYDDSQKTRTTRSVSGKYRKMHPIDNVVEIAFQSAPDPVDVSVNPTP